MRNIFILSVVLMACADTSKLDARIHDLEIQVAELRGRAAERAVTHDTANNVDRFGRAANGCVPVDNTVPENVTFSNAVSFDLGRIDLRAGDRIVIREVRGTQSMFAKDEMYLVRGEYTLASADEAELGFNVTGGCTTGNMRGRLAVKKGSGTFELATKMAYVGQPHVSFYVGGNGSGGVYFGKNEFLYK